MTAQYCFNTVKQRRTLFYTVTLLTFYAASSVPTPLYPIYLKVFDLTYMLLMVIFAVYSFSLVLTLLLTGSISDYIGRRPTIFIALLTLSTSVILFLTAKSFTWLVVARVFQGIAIGTAASAVGAALLDTDVRRGPVINSIAPLCGMAIGTLASSVLVQYAPYPLQLIHFVVLIIIGILAIRIWSVRETSVKRKGALRSVRPNILIPVHIRPNFIKMTPINVAAWILGSFYLSLVPSLVKGTLENSGPVVGGIVVGTLTFSGSLAVFLLRNYESTTVLRIAIPMMVTGVVILLTGVHLKSTTLLLIATFIAGIGFGSGFLGAARIIMPLASPAQRAGLLSAFYIECYLATSLPALMAGLLVQLKGIVFTTDIFGTTIILLTLGGALSFKFGSINSECSKLDVYEIKTLSGSEESN